MERGRRATPVKSEILVSVDSTPMLIAVPQLCLRVSMPLLGGYTKSLKP
jgi:hypothetical protein